MCVFLPCLRQLDEEPGAVIEIDFYHANSLLTLSDDALIAKAKSYLDTMLPSAAAASVIDAAVVRLPGAVNDYFPGSYRLRPDVRSSSFDNAYFVGDVTAGFEPDVLSVAHRPCGHLGRHVYQGSATRLLTLPWRPTVDRSFAIAMVRGARRRPTSRASRRPMPS